MLCRLFIDYALVTHDHILRGEEKLMCPGCHVPLTLAHVLLSFPRLPGGRARHLGRIASDVTLPHILGVDSDWVSAGSLFCFRNFQFLVIYRPCNLVA